MRFFDVFQETTWTLPTVLAWIMWRDVDKVRAFEVPERARELDHAETSLHLIDTAGMEYKPKAPVLPYLRFDQALNELQREAVYHDLKATARDIGTGEVGFIAQQTWLNRSDLFNEHLIYLYRRGFDPQIQEIESLYDKRAPLPEPHEHMLEDIRFERSDTIARWPELEPGRAGLPENEVCIYDGMGYLALNGKDLAGYNLLRTPLFYKASALLSEMIANGECVALGFDRETNDLGLIEAHMWRDIINGKTDYWGEFVRRGAGVFLSIDDETGPRWADVHVKFWSGNRTLSLSRPDRWCIQEPALRPSEIDIGSPADLGAQASTVPARAGTVAAETECRKYLISLMENGDPPSKTKSEYQKELTEKFQISVRAFLRQWARAIEKTENLNWNKPGRKKSYS